MVEPRNAGTLPYAYITLDKSAGVLRALFESGAERVVRLPSIRVGEDGSPGKIHTGASSMPTRVGGRARDIDQETRHETAIKKLGMKLRETRQGP